jgi:hypothetical protein
MSKRYKDKGRIEGQWAASRYQVLDSPAWRATSFGARALYIALVRQLSHSRFNNGNVFLSTRDAAEELGTRQMNIGPWYQELRHYGFIVMTSQSRLGSEGKGRAAEWRLTDWDWGPGCEKTREYLKWDGAMFDKKIFSRSTRRFRVKHTPLHTPEAHAASGPPKSEADAASHRPPILKHTSASHLVQPYPHLGKAAVGAEAEARPRLNGGSDDDQA